MTVPLNTKLESTVRYLEGPICHDISINGVEYRFDHVHPEATALPVTPEERSIAPGIIYVPR